MTETTIPKDIFAADTAVISSAPAVLIVTADKTEDTEFFYPYYRFIEAGFRVDVATPGGGEFKGKNGSGLKETKKLSDVNSADYQLLYIPGGKAPEKLKKEDRAIEIVREFVAADKPVAAICHGAQLLAESEVIQNRDIAAWPEIEEEIRDAGGRFVNKECVTSGPFITGRWPADLPAFTAQVMKALSSSVTSSVNKSRAA